MSTAMWIDGEHLSIGDAGFLVEISNYVKGSTRHELRDRPPTTNESRQPRPLGWCGTFNDTATHGCGIWRVIDTRPNGRAKLEEITARAEIEAFLDAVGFPDLIDECLAA